MIQLVLAILIQLDSPTSKTAWVGLASTLPASTVCLLRYSQRLSKNAQLIQQLRILKDRPLYTGLSISARRILSIGSLTSMALTSVLMDLLTNKTPNQPKLSQRRIFYVAPLSKGLGMSLCSFTITC